MTVEQKKIIDNFDYKSSSLFSACEKLSLMGIKTTEEILLKCIDEYWLDIRSNIKIKELLEKEEVSLINSKMSSGHITKEKADKMIKKIISKTGKEIEFLKNEKHKINMFCSRVAFFNNAKNLIWQDINKSIRMVK